MKGLVTEKKKTVAAVYLSGLLQGVALILFPAAGPLFTDPGFHALTSSQFGLLFTPQIVAAIAASAFAARCATYSGMKRMLLLGLVLNVLSMLLLAASHGLIGMGGLAYLLLLLGTSAVGAGFGFTISALNAYAFDLFQDRADAAVSGLHASIGMGQVGSSLILGFFLSLGFWWWAPLVIGAALLLMIGFQLGLPMKLSTESTEPLSGVRNQPLPRRIWIYAVMVFLYGVCEATYGNWSPIYLEQDGGLTLSEAAVALSVFWAMVTAGRVLFALSAIWFRAQALHMVSPFVIAASFLVFPSLSGSLLSMLGLALAGLALSFFFPLSVSLASAEEPALASTVSGILVAALALGVGFSSNLVGFVRETLGLSLIFRLSSLYAFLMAMIVVYLAQTKESDPRAKEAV
jgi:fucose permease